MPRGTHPNSLANLKKGKETQFGANGDSTAKEAGKKSAESRAQRKSMREDLLLMLAAEAKTKDGTPSGKSTQEAVMMGIIKKAAAGDVRAAEFIRDTIGEKPVERIANVTPDPDVIADVEKALFGK